MAVTSRPNKLAEDIFKNVMGDYKNISKKIKVKNTRVENGLKKQETEKNL